MEGLFEKTEFVEVRYLDWIGIGPLLLDLIVCLTHRTNYYALGSMWYLLLFIFKALVDARMKDDMMSPKVQLNWKRWCCFPHRMLH